jgi:hypothetical protein
MVQTYSDTSHAQRTLAFHRASLSDVSSLAASSALGDGGGGEDDMAKDTRNAEEVGCRMRMGRKNK